MDNLPRHVVPNDRAALLGMNDSCCRIFRIHEVLRRELLLT